jgi:hypothetical protein
VRTWAVENSIEIPERRKAGLEIDTKPVRPVLDAPEEKGPATSGTRRRPEDQKPSNDDHDNTDSRQKFLRIPGRKKPSAEDHAKPENERQAKDEPSIPSDRPPRIYGRNRMLSSRLHTPKHDPFSLTSAVSSRGERMRASGPLQRAVRRHRHPCRALHESGLLQPRAPHGAGVGCTKDQSEARTRHP